MITILYRGCDKELESVPSRNGRPSWFSKINNFKSIHHSIINSKFRNQIKLISLMDGDKSSLTDLISSFNYEILYIKAGSNNNSLKYQLNFAKDLGTDLYFLEDDYIHVPEAMNHIINGIKKFKLVTGYDHNDRYTRTDDTTKDKESIFFHEGIHWRTCESTTCTWAVDKNVFEEIFPIVNKYLLEDREFFRELYRNGIKLHSTIPGVSTHVHDPFMSPGIKWKEISESYKTKFNFGDNDV
jgi:hypothetical protein